jgi:hypothetical protein
MHGLQALWEWTVLLPVTAAQASEPRQEMGAWGYIGFVIYMLLFFYESGGVLTFQTCTSYFSVACFHLHTQTDILLAQYCTMFVVLIPS